LKFVLIYLKKGFKDTCKKYEIPFFISAVKK